VIVDELSIQERFMPDMTCFGCGPANELGLRLRSFAAGDFTIARFTPRPEHDNGLGFLNGGIICTILDCHSATPMLLEAERTGLISEEAWLPFVTAGLDVRYLRPTPLDQPSELHARIVSGDDTQMTVEAELFCDDKVRAAAVAVWKRWRPRGSESKN
jgi:acyl-coenzyme A thioesterase PaaI-like protein